MIFTPTELAGAFVIDLEPIADERGFFARAWCQHELEAHGVSSRAAQCNVSFNTRKGTLRGMHYQRAPLAEVKIVRCTRGSIYDVIVDLRQDSPTHKRWIGVELSAENRRALYVPEGFAHGYLTLEDASETFYQVSEFYTPGAEGGLRWDDEAFGIVWPGVEISVVSEKDRAWPKYEG